MSFLTIAEKSIPNRSKDVFEIRLCPDQYVGEIKKFTDKFSVRKPVKERPINTKCLIMVLESPHVDEFKGEPAPANGPTGDLIIKHILSIKGLSIYPEYGLILVNAIQNQCSLGCATKHYRDQVFISVWNQGAKDIFVERLQNVYQKGDVIINCCTKGYTKNQELRRLVQHSIPTNMGEVHRRTHPSSWHSDRNRNSEWKLA